jgi:hypothetical protein
MVLRMDDLHASQRPKFTGQACDLHPSTVTVQAIDLAAHRAEYARRQSRLLSPAEAMALALGEARDKDTLYSIARAAAWETGSDVDDVLCHLGERFPDFA